MHCFQGRFVYLFGICSSIFAVSSAAPSPKETDIRAHTNDIHERTCNCSKKKVSDVTFNVTNEPLTHITTGINIKLTRSQFDCLNPGELVANYGGMEWSEHFRAVNSEFWASSPPNAAFAFAPETSPSSSERMKAKASFKVLPDSRHKSFSIYEAQISPIVLGRVWPPLEYVFVIRALLVDGGNALVQRTTVGGLNNFQYPVMVNFIGIDNVNKVEMYVEFRSGDGIIYIPFAIDNIVIRWNKISKTSDEKQAISFQKSDI